MRDSRAVRELFHGRYLLGEQKVFTVVYPGDEEPCYFLVESIESMREHLPGHLRELHRLDGREEPTRQEIDAFIATLDELDMKPMDAIRMMGDDDFNGEIYQIMVDLRRREPSMVYPS